MNCQMFSAGLSSGDLGGKGIRVMFSGTLSFFCRVPAGLVQDYHAMGASRDLVGDLV